MDQIDCFDGVKLPRRSGVNLLRRTGDNFSVFSNLSNLINALRLHLFAKIELNQFINKPFEKSSHWEPENIQLSLFT
jgi:hypothetical protein